MLYASSGCFGQGHGCAVEWNSDSIQPDYIKSSFMPYYNYLQMKARRIEGMPVFNMKYLFTADSKDIISNLEYFVQEYKDWIADLEKGFVVESRVISLRVLEIIFKNAVESAPG